MFKKANNLIFIILFLAMLFIPLLFTTWESGGVSEAENRNLAKFPELMADGKINPSFTADFETWFMDHLGFRQILIDANKDLQQKIFNRSLTTSDYKVGKTGDSIYATDAIIRDYAHVNLRTAEEVAQIGNSYQTVSDWLGSQGIPFYYVQCVDKHTIYPERFIPSIKQIGSTSKTDQVIEYLQNSTTVNTIYIKPLFNEMRQQYPVFSRWGDPTHWTPYGAFLGYTYIMEHLNQDMEQPLKILREDDYEFISTVNTGPDGQTEEIYRLKLVDPKAQKADVSVMGQWAEDQRHSVWTNPEAGNDTRLLLMCDSYINSFLIEDFAESFAEVWLVWGDYTADLPEIVNLCDPDLVIYECAERVDRSSSVCSLAERLSG